MQEGIKLLDVTKDVEAFNELISSNDYMNAPPVILEVLASHMLETYYIHDRYFRTHDDRMNSERYEIASNKVSAMLRSGHRFGPKMVELLALSTTPDELLKLTKKTRM